MPAPKTFEIISPSCTGMGLEILRTAPLIRAALRTGWKPRLWTFHPGAFDGSQFEIVPLQQGWAPLLPFSENLQHSAGVIWLPHAHPQGPYVCRRTLAEALARGCKGLDGNVVPCEPGAYPAFVSEIAQQIFGDDGAHDDDIDPLYPADASARAAPIILNLVGAHGSDKGLTDAGTVCTVASQLADRFLDRSWCVLLNARVCAGQRAILSSKNLRKLVHLDTDPQVARCISRHAQVITVEGGLAHFAVQRGIRPLVVGFSQWLDDTAYLYPANGSYRRCEIDTFDPEVLFGAVENLLEGTR